MTTAEAEVGASLEVVKEVTEIVEVVTMEEEVASKEKEVEVPAKFAKTIEDEIYRHSRYIKLSKSFS